MGKKKRQKAEKVKSNWERIYKLKGWKSENLGGVAAVGFEPTPSK